MKEQLEKQNECPKCGGYMPLVAPFNKGGNWYYRCLKCKHEIIKSIDDLVKEGQGVKIENGECPNCRAPLAASGPDKYNYWIVECHACEMVYLTYLTEKEALEVAQTENRLLR